LSEVVCYCCGEQRHELRAHKSKLIADKKYMFCSKCKAAGHEPRYVLILVARAEGTNSVAEFIRGGKYCGQAILGREMIP